jgi:phosphopantetheinyl transferase (holo-ACP synthase)
LNKKINSNKNPVKLHLSKLLFFNHLSANVEVFTCLLDVEKLIQILQSENIDFEYYIDGIKSEAKVLERLNQLLVLKSSIHLGFDKIKHLESGKPILSKGNTNISISNSLPYVAVQYGNGEYLGVDIQTFTSKIQRISTKFTTDLEIEKLMSENFDRITSLHLLWSSKEAIYKALQIKGLLFREEILFFAADNVNQTLDFLINHEGKKYFAQLQYFLNKDFCLVFVLFINKN